MSMQAVESHHIRESVEFKDRVIIYKSSGEIIDMTVVKMSDETILGALTRDPLQSITVDIKTIEKIEVESVDGTKTTFAVIGGILLLPFVILGAIIGIADSVDVN
ncbi:MAG: hypothetical protein HWE27_03765 [Gammaproteobacteria bacterium]|nr:hypothetical protein [Gammaproteobacteria bacterium]